MIMCYNFDPNQSQGPITPHTIITLPNSKGLQLLLCYDSELWCDHNLIEFIFFLILFLFLDEGVYVNTYGNYWVNCFKVFWILIEFWIILGKVSKNIVLQWGEMPTSVAFIGTGQIMGWGNKAIEIRGVETGHLDGVFMHKKAQKLKFLCERNDKVFNNSFYS